MISPYIDYEEMYDYPLLAGGPYAEDATRVLPEPTAVERLAALGDPRGAAAARVKRWDDDAVFRRTLFVVIRVDDGKVKITARGAP